MVNGSMSIWPVATESMSGVRRGRRAGDADAACGIGFRQNLAVEITVNGHGGDHPDFCSR